MTPTSTQMNRRIIAGVIALLVIIVMFIIATIIANRPSQPTTNTAATEKVIARRIGNTDFRITNTLVDSDGWQLVRIEPLNGNGGEGGFVVLQQEGDVVTLKVGPGSYISDSSLRSAGVPSQVQSEMKRALGRG